MDILLDHEMRFIDVSESARPRALLLNSDLSIGTGCARDCKLRLRSRQMSKNKIRLRAAQKNGSKIKKDGGGFVRIAFYGDSLTAGLPGVSTYRLLEAKLPEHQLINLGRSGDTVRSLYRRILKDPTPLPFDIAVIWIGVNDILPKLSFSHTILKRVRNQPPAKDLDEFREVYERMLRVLRCRANHILMVTPLLIGEDVANRWNVELSAMSTIVAQISDAESAGLLVDLHTLIAAELAGRTISDYVPRRLARIAWDVFAVRGPHEVDALASERGLHFTLDGVHLNSAGARWVANANFEKLEPLLTYELEQRDSH